MQIDSLRGEGRVNEVIYYIGDMHLGHKNVIEYDNRPFVTIEEMDATLINNWNCVVKEQDHVYIIGDFVIKVQMK